MGVPCINTQKEAAASGTRVVQRACACAHPKADAAGTSEDARDPGQAPGRRGSPLTILQVRQQQQAQLCQNLHCSVAKQSHPGTDAGWLRPLKVRQQRWLHRTTMTVYIDMALQHHAAGTAKMLARTAKGFTKHCVPSGCLPFPRCTCPPACSRHDRQHCPS